MNKQRLMELAGLSSNMNNPSQEPYTEIPAAAEDPTGAPGINGQDELGGEGEIDTLERIREEARKGVDNPEEAARSCQVILSLMDEEEDVDGEEF